MKKRAFCFLLFCVSAAIGCLNFTACFKTAEKSSYTFAGPFDTAVTVVSYSADKKLFDKICMLIEENMNRCHRLFDIYNTYDGLNNLKSVNDSAGRSRIPVDKDIIELVKFGKEMYGISGGRLNIMLGAVLKIWHKYAEEGNLYPEKARIPDTEELKDASAHCDINSLAADETANTLFIADPLASIDVGALAKGFALQKTAELLKNGGYDNILINAGGNIAAVGTKRGGRMWNAAVQSPDNPNGYIGGRKLSDSALSTSGDYQRFYTVNGKNYHHIIDPETLFPCENTRSATVFAARADYADALSTIIFLMPPEEGIEFIENIKCAEALVMTKDGKILTSSGWKQEN